ncbi:RNA-binding cell elongation regulator Jag/EloR [Carboxydothermus hydrogenoformans]|uniref:RNA-binding protein KhpB n=1 Tax=Carboxydothermus hydrogenoformans (strain ATCC BAA-161 / DSM 6008 / Z-2901) TaxID=246194 RepID=Q3AG57_CARHZ|nr:RNA-binding cell elongation regulator Jag/EloR [Carboxydothermus hydrogenoformans]ABB16180.1 jag protein [Carboxydothermus hydrogenoformans Z-2901]
MREIEVTGKTVEEAVSLGLEQLGVDRSLVEIEILEQPSKGILGLFGQKPAKVKLTIKSKVMEKARKFLDDVISAMGVNVGYEVLERDDHLLINLYGSDVGILIGYRGETLDALQYITNLAANKNEITPRRIILDAQGYRERREKTLIRLAEKVAEKVRQKGRPFALEPMTPQERRIIHTALQNFEGVYTYSEGEDPNRKVIIAPKR